MATPTVGVMSPGDMGHSIGNVLRHGGLRVITCLQGRSPRTAALAAEAGIVDVGDYETLVREADILLSVLAPAQARALAERVAAAVRATGADLLFVECNAIAPQTVREIGTIVTAAGARFVDAGIIGSPPRPGERRTRIYASGEHAAEFAQLGQYGLDIRVIGSEIGQASGLKMCYAALTKGLTALATELLVAGEAMGLSAPLRAELQLSQGILLGWVGEMEEIAATFAALGLTPRMLEGAAALYRFVEQTPLGAETPEQRQRGQTLDEVVAILVEALPAAGVAAGERRG